MGRTGRIPGSFHGEPPGPKPNPERRARLREKPRATVARPAAIEVGTTTRPIPDPPPHLRAPGRKVWAAVFGGLPISVVDETLDTFTVTRLAELADDRAAARSVLAKLGMVLTEPIVSPSGAVVGERVVMNPVVAAMRAMDRELDVLSTALGLHPAARARLGLVVSKAQLAQVDAQHILSRMYAKEAQ